MGRGFELLCRKAWFQYKEGWYSSWEECCRLCNIDYNTVVQYKEKHYCTWSEAVNNVASRYKFKYRDNWYLSPQECCSKLSISFKLTASLKRMYQLTWEEAIDKQLGHEIASDIQDTTSPTTGFVYKGKDYPSVRTCCRQLRLNYAYVDIYRKRHECSWEESINFYRNKRKYALETSEF